MVRFWVGGHAGLSRLGPEREGFEHFAVDPGTRAGLAYPLVTALELDEEGTLWIATWGGGVSRLDTRSLDFLPSLARDRESLAQERVAALEMDPFGALWVGTWSQGLMRALRPQLEAGLITSAQGLAYDDVTALLEDSRGGLWAGTWGRGLSFLPPGASRFDQQLHEKLDVISKGTVLALEEAGGGAVWAGTMGPLYHISPDGEMVTYAHDPGDASSIGPGYVTAVLVDSDGDVWAGVGGSGLYRMSGELDGTFEAFVHDPDDPATLSDDYVTALAEDHEGRLWVGTRSGGLNVVNRAEGSVTRHATHPTRPDALSYHYVTALTVDAAGSVWIATAGGGLNRAVHDESGVRFERWGEEEGLLDDIVRSIASEGGLLWVGTAQGLTRFDVERAEFFNFTAANGLPASGFNAGAAFAGEQSVYLGTSAGLLVIRRGAKPRRAPAAPTILREIQTAEEGPPLPAAPWQLERLEVPYGEILSFEFGVLDFGDPKAHRFAYRLAGLREEWIELGDRREITFTDLDPGRYTLEIRGRSARGEWSVAPQALVLSVVPPFWMTMWFRAGLLALVGLVAYGAHRRRTIVLERRNEALSELKDEREEALVKMHESRAALGEAYGRLRRLTRRLEQAKEDERTRIARELHDEMGQGLTAAKINLELVTTSASPLEERARVDDALQLLDEMIQRVRTLSLDLRPALLDELGLKAALRGYLEAQAQRSGLTIDISELELPDQMSPEAEITAFRFVQEALSNVLRHAAAERVVVRVTSDGGNVVLRVSDDGRGFDLDAAMARAASGQHLGLLGMRERVEALGGELSIRAKPSRGTSLEVTIPSEVRHEGPAGR